MENLSMALIKIQNWNPMPSSDRAFHIHFPRFDESHGFYSNKIRNNCSNISKHGNVAYGTRKKHLRHILEIT